jgi:heptose I phosphotransferase
MSAEGYLRSDMASAWAGQRPVEAAFTLEGEVFRDVPGRRTMKVRIAEQSYFVKLHYGVGWREVVKNWLQFKIPVIGARNEYEACVGLQRSGITAPLVAAFGESQGSIAKRRSFVLCDVLKDYTSLEDVTNEWFDHPPAAQTRHRLLYAVARFARRFHQAGYIHRDFYICHLLGADHSLDGDAIELAVLDLHRARHFQQIPARWLKRDLAALLYSTLDLGYTSRDWLRFVALYSGRPLREELEQNTAFWQSVILRAEKLYRQGQRKGLVKGLYRRPYRELNSTRAKGQS